MYINTFNDLFLMFYIEFNKMNTMKLFYFIIFSINEVLWPIIYQSMPQTLIIKLLILLFAVVLPSFLRVEDSYVAL